MFVGESGRYHLDWHLPTRPKMRTFLPPPRWSLTNICSWKSDWDPKKEAGSVFLSHPYFRGELLIFGGGEGKWVRPHWFKVQTVYFFFLVFLSWTESHVDKDGFGTKCLLSWWYLPPPSESAAQKNPIFKRFTPPKFDIAPENRPSKKRKEKVSQKFQGFRCFHSLWVSGRVYCLDESLSRFPKCSHSQ